jgi:hypothetical protein
MSALTPTVELGAQWPPLGIEPVNAFELPLLNTVILLSSGATITYAHHSLIQGDRKGSLYGSIATVILAIIFTGLNFINMLFFYFGLLHTKVSLRDNDNLAPQLANRTSLKDRFIFRTYHGSKGALKRLYSIRIDVKEPKLSPYWVTGFADAESTFSLKVSKSGATRSGWNIVPEFQITLHSRDLLLLRKIHSFFGVGVVSERQTRDQVYYTVQSARTIANVIIPHFDVYPLITQKKADYLLFKQGIGLLLSGQSRSSIEGINKILSIKKSMNKGLSDTLKINFPTILPESRTEISGLSIPDPHWLRGFVDGEGYFYVKSLKNKKYSTGFSVNLIFSISQHARDKVLLTTFIEYLGCGRIEKASTRPDEVNFVVSKFSDIKEKIIPFFKTNPLEGIKNRDLLDFVEVANIIEAKGHLTLEGVNKINSLKSGMNSSRVINKL